MVKTRMFTVPGVPVGKGRPRSVSVGGSTWHYTPKGTREAENWVRDQYAIQCRGAEMIPKDKPIVLNLECVFSIPMSASGRKRAQMLAGVIRPTKKPDTDNCLKLVADALNGIAYHDDSQIVSCTVSKVYGDEPCMRIWISGAE